MVIDVALYMILELSATMDQPLLTCYFPIIYHILFLLFFHVFSSSSHSLFVDSFLSDSIIFARRKCKNLNVIHEAVLELLSASVMAQVVAVKTVMTLLSD